jgi:hypothetical protein
MNNSIEAYEYEINNIESDYINFESNNNIESKIELYKKNINKIDLLSDLLNNLSKNINEIVIDENIKNKNIKKKLKIIDNLYNLISDDNTLKTMTFKQYLEIYQKITILIDNVLEQFNETFTINEISYKK